MRDLKLIWDFKGPAGQGTAQHHLIHLQEYLDQNAIPYIDTGVDVLSPNHSLAYVALNEQYMSSVRDTLKPHRGQLWQPKSS